MEELYRINADLDVPTPAVYGIDKDEWFSKREIMAEQAISSGSPAFNPHIASAEEVVQLYADVYE